MNEILARRFTGWSCLAAALALIVVVPLYFVYDGPPPDANVLTRLLISILALGAVLLFATGFRELVRTVSPAYAWAGGLAFAGGLGYVVINLVSNGLEAGAVIAAAHPVDPTISEPGTYLLYGTIGRMMTAIFLISVGYAIARTGVLPRWTGRTATVLGTVSLAFMPSLFFGNDPAFFYAANGWGTTATMGALFSLWLLATGIATVRSVPRTNSIGALNKG